MKRLAFGRSDLLVSPIGLGCVSMSGYYGPQDDDECIVTLQEAIDSGINLLDTSSNYGEGHNQELIGKAIRGRRDEVVIHSKIGSIRPDGITVVSGTPAHVRQSAEGGLKRLGVDYVDVICISRVDPVVPIEETVGVMADLVREGKTRYIAISKDATAEIIARAMAVHPLISLQDEYSLIARGPEAELLGACRQHGLAFIAFAPLGRGLLAGAFRSRQDIPAGDRRHRDSRFQGKSFEQNIGMVEQVAAVAKDKGVSVAVLALAWLMHQPGTVIPIPSSKTRVHLRENIQAAELALGDEDLARIAAACPFGVG